MDAFRQSALRSQMGKPLPAARKPDRKAGADRVSDMIVIGAHFAALDRKLDTLIRMLKGPGRSHHLLPADVRHVVALFFGVSEEDIDRRGRAGDIVRIRQIAFYLCRVRTRARSPTSGGRSAAVTPRYGTVCGRSARCARPMPRSTTISVETRNAAHRDAGSAYGGVIAREQTNMAKRKNLLSADAEWAALARRTRPEFPPAQVKRLRDAAMAGLRDPEWGTELGRLYLEGTITAAMYAAGKDWREKAARYVSSLGHFPVRSILVENRGGSLPPDPDTPEGRKRARREADAMERFFEAHHVLLGAGSSRKRRCAGSANTTKAPAERRS